MKAFTSAVKMMSPSNFMKCLYLNHRCEPLRYISKGSLVVKKLAKTNLLKKDGKKLMVKLQKKKRSRQQLPSSLYDSEEEWLNQLTFDNLNIYRKTSKGRYKKIDNSKFLSQVKVLNYFEYEGSEVGDPADVPVNVPADVRTDSPVSLPVNKAKKTLKQESDLSEVKLSNFLMKHMLSFPMLRTDFESFDKTGKSEDGFEVKEFENLPSVTKVLNETMSAESKYRLLAWRSKMIQELGESGFYKHKRDPEVTFEVNESNKLLVDKRTKRKRIIVDIMSQGTKLHGSLRQYLESEGKAEVRIDPQVEGCWKSLEPCLSDISEVKFLEQPLCHPLLMYKGVVDCVANYRNVPCVIEWKRAEKRKGDLDKTYDAPLQLCAYLGALSWDENVKPKTFKNGLIVIAYADGSPADVFLMQPETCETYWFEWLRRLQSFWAQRTSQKVESVT